MSLDLLDATPEGRQEHPHKSRMTLMSPTECEIVRCIPNQLEMMPNSTLLDLEQSPVPNHTVGLSYFRQLQRFPETPVSSLEEHQFQHRNSRKAPWIPYHFEKTADSQDSIEEVRQLSTNTLRVPFPQQ